MVQLMTRPRNCKLLDKLSPERLGRHYHAGAWERGELNQQFENAAKPVIALVSFRDSVKIEVISDDLNILLKALEKLEAKDGGLCPEASAQALDLALDHIKPNGLILFVTDAPPYEGTNIEALKAKIVAKQANFVPIVTTSDCATNQLSSPQQ
jgi:hypothetical protein